MKWKPHNRPFLLLQLLVVVIMMLSAFVVQVVVSGGGGRGFIKTGGSLVVVDSKKKLLTSATTTRTMITRNGCCFHDNNNKKKNNNNRMTTRTNHFHTWIRHLPLLSSSTTKSKCISVFTKTTNNNKYCHNLPSTTTTTTTTTTSLPCITTTSTRLFTTRTTTNTNTPSSTAFTATIPTRTTTTTLTRNISCRSRIRTTRTTISSSSSSSSSAMGVMGRQHQQQGEQRMKLPKDLHVPRKFSLLQQRNYYDPKKQYQYQQQQSATTTTTTFLRTSSSSSSCSSHDDDDPLDEDIIGSSTRYITYVTDIEGDQNYLHNFVQLSKMISFRPVTIQDRIKYHLSTSTKEIEEREEGHSNNPTLYFPYDHCIDFISDNDDDDMIHTNNKNNIFVFGGDVWDQGGSDLYVIRQLLVFQRQYPNRVYFIMGNRDINKMCMTQELGILSSSTGSSSSSNNNEQKKMKITNDSRYRITNHTIPTPPIHHGVYWLRGTGYMGDPNLGTFKTTQTAIKRLKWMLQYTMGSPRAFQYRKDELQQELEFEQLQEQEPLDISSSPEDNDISNNIHINGNDRIHQQQQKEEKRIEVTDEDVVFSYLRSCHPITGEMGCYLQKAQLVLRMGDVMFVHGGLPISPRILKEEKERNNNTVTMNPSNESNDGPTTATTTATTTTTTTRRQSLWNDMRFAMPWLLLPVPTIITESQKTPSTTDDVEFHNDYDNKNNEHPIYEQQSKQPHVKFDQWITELNQFAQDCVQSWRECVVPIEKGMMNKDDISKIKDENERSSSSSNIHDGNDSKRTWDMWSWTGGYHPSPNVPKFTQLIQYGMGSLPNRQPNPTVVYSGWRHFVPDGDTMDGFVDTNNNTVDESVQSFLDETRHFMIETGIRLICCGHQPQGDMPNIIRVPLVVPSTTNHKYDHDRNNPSLSTAFIVSADTSYSGDTMWWNDDENDHDDTYKGTNDRLSSYGRGTIKSGRGPVAVSEVLIKQCIKTGRIVDTIFHGVLSDGTSYETRSLLVQQQQPTYSNNTTTTTNEQDEWIVGQPAPFRVQNKYPITTPANKESSNTTMTTGTTIGSIQSVQQRGWWTRASFFMKNNNKIDQNNSSNSNKNNNIVDVNTSDFLLLVYRKGFQVWNRIIKYPPLPTSTTTIKTKK